jgi:FkbM family methyltransferase
MRWPDKTHALLVLRDRGFPIQTIIDVGVQHHTRELIRVFPDRKHVLFEPVVEYRDSIARAYAKIDHVLVQAAVGDRPGQVTLQVRTIGERQKCSYSTVVAGPADARDKRVVTMVTLDGFLSRYPQKTPYLLKIDVDGLEMSILRGAPATLRCASAVIIEVPKANLTERISYLEAAGFEIFDLVENCYYDTAFSQCDAIMIKKEMTKEFFSDPTVQFDERKYAIFQAPR